MAPILDFAKTGKPLNNRTLAYSSSNKGDPLRYITEFVIALFKLSLGVVFIISSVSNIFKLYKLYTIYYKRKEDLIKGYVLLIKKKNQFDYVSSPGYELEQMRRIYGAFNKGEREVVVIGDIDPPRESSQRREEPYWERWRKLLFYGVDSLSGKK